LAAPGKVDGKARKEEVWPDPWKKEEEEEEAEETE
jgi:hypothetical protein